MMTRLAKTVMEPTAKNGFIFTLLGKTQHRSFRVIVPLFTCLWLVIVTGAYLYFNVFR